LGVFEFEAEQQKPGAEREALRLSPFGRRFGAQEEGHIGGGWWRQAINRMSADSTRLARGS
jgi:hypothetical protein